MPDHSDLSLYQTAYCPYCERVRAAIRRLELDIEVRDIDAKSAWHSELVEATGRQTVPCLRIHRADGEDEWLHESAAIIGYLEERFGS
jgi:glutathione S-transferase